MLTDPRVIAGVRDFISVLVKVPEAYALVQNRQASRPGFLFLDAEKQRLADVCLAKMNNKGVQTFDPPDVPAVVSEILKACEESVSEPSRAR